MNCQKCGFQLTENDQFCKNCGASVNNTDVQNSSLGLNNQTIQSSMQGVSYQSMNNYTEPTQQSSWANKSTVQSINQTSKDNNIKFIIIGIIVARAIIGIIAAVGLFGDNKSNNSETNNGSSSYTVKFNGFTFKVPTNLVYETQTDALLIGDEDGTWTVSIEVIDGSYSQMLSNKNQLQTMFQSTGYTASVPVEKTIKGMSFITLELSKSSSNVLLGLTRANSMNLFGISAYNIDNEYDYKLLEKISTILSSAEYSGSTNNISIFEKPDMSGIGELAK